MKMKINKSFFVLFLLAWSIGVVAINYFNWIWLADLSFIAILFIYVIRAELSVSEVKQSEERKKEKRIHK
jgi:hypothetical protein